MSLPERMNPWLFRARVHRVIDGDSVKLHLDLGFGLWWLCTIYPGTDKEAKYPQGVYRLYGINTPEIRGAEKSEGLVSMARVNELLSLSATGDDVLVGTRKEKVHGKYRYMLDVYIDMGEPKEEEDFGRFEYSWLSNDELTGLYDQLDPDHEGTLKALLTEVLANRQLNKRYVHLNEQLVIEGLAEEYDGGAK